MTATLDASPVPALPSWLEKELPFTRRMGRVAGRAIHLIDHGKGRPVLLLHGNPTWSFLWRKVIARLPPGFRAIAPDLFGFGLSDKPAELAAHSLDAHVRTICGLVEALDLQNAILVGQDWGGPIAAGVAARAPQRFTAALFANTTVLEPRKPIRTALFHRVARAPLLSTLLFRGAGFPLPVLRSVQGDPRSIGKLERRAYGFPLDRWSKRAGPLALARMVPHREGHPSLPVIAEGERWARQFKGPVELVWGVRDPILGRGLKRLREVWPDAKVTETQAGHFLQEEVPQELAEAITRLGQR